MKWQEPEKQDADGFTPSQRQHLSRLVHASKVCCVYTHHIYMSYLHGNVYLKHLTDLGCACKVQHPTPTPSTLRPTPSTLHPTPSTTSRPLLPTTCTLLSAPYTLNLNSDPKPKTLNPKP